MPFYTFKNETTGEVKDVWMGMKEKHVYSEGGVKWRRVWISPQLAFDTKIDPNDEKAFVKKTGQKAGTIGEIWDRARDLQEDRASRNGGIDPKTGENVAEKNKKESGEITMPIDF